MTLLAERLSSAFETAALGHVELRMGHRPVDARRASSERRLFIARDFLRAHYFEDLYVRDLAAAANMSEFHFSRAYRKRFGMSPLQDLLDQRVSLAEHLLTTTELDIAAIAKAVGFESRSTLFRQFVRARGVSPLVFRRQWRSARRERAFHRLPEAARVTLSA